MNHPRTHAEHAARSTPRGRTSLLLLLPLALAACGENAAPVGPGADVLVPIATSGATTNNQAGFFFLPPMVPNPGPFTGIFDPNVVTTVRVCELPACTTAIKTFNGGSGAERITVDLEGESYNALWNTRNNPSDLQLGQDVYRLDVVAGGETIGSIRLWFVSNSQQLRSVPPGYVGVVRGSTLNIKYRIETAGRAPAAIDDDYRADVGQALVVAAPGVLANDELGQPAATGIASITVAGVTYTSLPQVNIAFAGGNLSVASDGAIVLSNPTVAGPHTFSYTLSNGVGAPSSATVTITVNPVNAPPVAGADAYDALGNVVISVPAPGVLANDTDPNNDPLSAVPGTIATTGGGTVQMSADGSFTYVGAPGFTGGDSFIYTVTNGSLSAQGTVTMTVTGRYWFVDAAAAPAGDGRQHRPFQSLAPLNGDGGAGDPDQPDDFILIRSGSYAGGIALETGQRLIGQGIPASLTAMVNGQTIVLLAGGAAPTLGSASGATVALGSGNTVRGLRVGGAAAGAAISGASVGGLTISSVKINTPGQALALTGSGATASVAIDSLVSTGGVNNVKLSDMRGSVALGGGAISGSTGTAFDVVGGDAHITYAGSITNTAGRSVSVVWRESGSVTLSGDINDTGSGIDVRFNSAGTVRFTGTSKTLSTGANTAVTIRNHRTEVSFTGGGLTINTTSGGGLVVTNGAFTPTADGGGVEVSGANNTITTTTGTALRVDDVFINGTFRSISSNGAPNGIVLINAGGSVSVTGAGGVCTVATPTCTGGRIQASAGADGAVAGNGVYLEGTSNVSLSHMRIDGSQNHGVRGIGVSGFSLANSLVQGNGTNAGGIGEGGVYFLGLTGSSTISGTTVSQHASGNGLYVYNTAGTLNLAVTGSTFSNSENDGILVEAHNSANVVVNVGTTNFSANKGDHVQVAPNNASVVSATITGGTFTGGHPTALGQGITMRAGGSFSGTFTYDINGITINSAILPAINTGFGSTSPGGVVQGKIRNNTIGTAGAALSGSAQASCILAETNGPGTGTHTVAITGNTIRSCSDRGIELFGSRDGSNTLNATVTGNNINDLTGPFSRHAIHLESGSSLGTEAGTICADIQSNTMTAATAVDEIRVRLRSSVTARFPGYTGGTTNNTQLAAYLAGRNPAGGTASVDIAGLATANNTSGGGACPTPP